MDNLKLYSINIESKTLKARGTALVVACTFERAFSILQRQGFFNGHPEEYVLLSYKEIPTTQIYSDEILVGETWDRVGPVGPKGDKGEKGDKGNTGPQGPQGIPGDTNFFVAIYNITPLSTIWQQHFLSHKKVFVKKEEELYAPYYMAEDQCSFYCIDPVGYRVQLISVSSDGWEEGYNGTLLIKEGVEDSLTSTSTDSPLSANMGKELNDKINNLESNVFIAEYDVASYAEVSEAMGEGKVVLALRNGKSFDYAGEDPDAAVFTNISDDGSGVHYISILRLSFANEWSTSEEYFSYIPLSAVTTTLDDPDDAHLPTTKCVKDNLDAKLDKPSTEGTAGQVLTSNGQGGQTWEDAAGGVFVATYNSTPFADMYAAYNAGKIVMFTRSDNVYILASATASQIVFFSPGGETQFFVSSGGVWTYNARPLEKTANKATSLTSASTDSQYPSAKCVYDLIGNIESILNAI